MSSFKRLREQAGMSVASAAGYLGLSEKTIRRYDNGVGNPRPGDIRSLEVEVMLADRSATEIPKQEFTFIDLFAGIGGLRRGFESIGGRCVFTSEWDKYAQATYHANHRDNREVKGDIRHFSANPDEIPEHDVLLAGFPCQPFSIAGVSKKNALGRPHGFLCDTQGTLFYDTAEIIRHHRPPAFLLENVKNLQRHNKGNTYATIMNVLTNELGYHVRAQVINAMSWVPQKRERIFIVGFRDQSEFTFDDLLIPDPASGPKIGDILEPEVDPKYTLTDHLWGYLQAYKEKHASQGHGFGFGLVGPNDVARTLSARYYKDGSEILVEQPGKNPRRLTPRECARLMGFDRCDESKFKIPVSDTQAYKQFGNSVVVPVVEAVAKHMAPHIQMALATTKKSAA